MEAQSDLSWQRNSLAAVLRLAWPITVSTISYTVMTLVDTLLVGHLGAAELAGVGLGGTAAFVLLCFSFGLLRGVKTLVSQAIGAGRDEQTGAYLGAALYTALAIGVVTIGLGQVMAELLARMSASPQAGQFARTYLHIRNLGAPMALAYVALREVRYGKGDARTPMVATVIANLVNIGLASLFIYGLKWGVRGAAIATVIAHTVEAGVLVLAQQQDGWHVRGTRMEHVRALFRVGFPTGVQWTLEVGAFAMLAGMVSLMSEVQMAAHQIALQVIHFSFMPAFALGEAASVLAGQAVGADRDDLVLKVARVSLLAAVLYTGLCTLILAGFAPLIVLGFTRERQLATVAVTLLHVAAVFQVFDGANVIARAVLRGVGDVRYPAVIGAVTAWACTPPLTWLLGWRLKLGAFGGWLGLCVEIILLSLILWRRLWTHRWRAAADASRAQLKLVEQAVAGEDGGASADRVAS
jgi:multidrug resistance protein, MATE family